MDTTAILVALSAFLSSAITATTTAIVSSKLTNFRLEALETKVDKHNDFVTRLAVNERDIATAHERIDTCEQAIIAFGGDLPNRLQKYTK